eukprot:2416736-Pyramimonas_sp.AAC.1
MLEDRSVRALGHQRKTSSLCGGNRVAKMPHCRGRSAVRARAPSSAQEDALARKRRYFFGYT